MRTTTKASILFGVAFGGCFLVSFLAPVKPTLIVTHRPDGSIESIGSTTYQHKPGDGLRTNPAPSDGLLVSKCDDAKWVDATMIPSNKCRVGWNCGIKAGEFVPVSRWTLAQEMEFSESRRPRKQAKTEDPCPPRSWSGAVYQSSGASNSPNIIGGCGSVTIINGEQN